MPKATFTLLALLLSLGLLTAGAQDSRRPPIRYSLMFGNLGAGVRVVSYNDQDQWGGIELRARVLFGDVDGFYSVPQWSPDGLTLYSTAYTPNSNDQASTLYGFYLTSGAFAPLIDFAPPLAEGQAPAREFILTESISPDGQSLWLRWTQAPQTGLFQLESQSLAPSPCVARLLAWGEDTAMTVCTGQDFQEPLLYLLDSDSGEALLALAPPPADPANAFASLLREGQFLGDGRFVLGDFGPGGDLHPVGVLELGGEGQAYYFGLGLYPHLDAEQEYLSFYQDGALKRVNLADYSLEDFGPAMPSPASPWEGETFAYWRVSEDRGYEIIRTRITDPAQGPRSFIAYRGPKPNEVLFAPRGEQFLLQFAAGFSESRVVLYAGQTRLWDSAEAYPGSYVSFPPLNEYPLMWAGRGRWLHLRHIPAPGLPAESLALNIITGRSLTAVEARGIYMGESPDGRWWLFALSTDPAREQRDRLIAYEPLTDRVEVLFPGGVPLYANVQYPDWRYLLWSPPVGGD